MLHKIRAKLFFLTFICIFVTACISTKHEPEPLTTKQQTKLYLKMGVRYMEMNMLITAKENLQKALKIAPDNGKAHNAMGALYERLKQYEMARKHYQSAIQFSPDKPSIKNNFGRFLCERGEHETGMQLLQQALKMPLNNRKWFAYTNIGRCELQSGQQKKAEANFRQALQTNKRFSPALFEMLRISYRSKKYMSARGFLERYLGVSSHTAKTLWYAVQTERALGNKKQAEKYQEMLFQQFPASKETQQLQIN